MLPQSCWRVQGLCDHTDGIHCYFVTAAVQAASAVSVANFYRVDHRMYKAAEPGDGSKARVKTERGAISCTAPIWTLAVPRAYYKHRRYTYFVVARAPPHHGDQDNKCPLCGL